jgi:undecaprenyl-diphosphatase
MLEYSHSVWRWLRRDTWRIAFLFVGILLPLIFFGKLADEVHEGATLSWDEAILYSIHHNATPQLDWLIINAERTGGFLTLPFLLVVVFALRFLQRARNAAFFALCVGGAYALNVLAKLVFQRERPALWTSPLPETNYSFPSGHAMVSMAIAVAFTELSWRTKWRWPVVLLGIGSTLAIGFSRLYLGVHYPSDVLGGWSAGLLWACGLYLLLKRDFGCER